MRRPSLGLAFGLGLALALAASFAAQAADPAYHAPHNALGQPDLEGVWTNASLTTLQRPAQYSKLAVTADEAKAAAAAEAKLMARTSAPTNPANGALAAGDNPGGYNTFWIDRGDGLAEIGGQFRTSWIVEPADGKIPYRPEVGRTIAERRARRTNFDNPETRNLGERCLVGYGSTSGPPMLNVLYNNNYQFVQTADAVTILVEMNHDARIIRLDTATHLPANMKPWMGDSIGHWDGDTLVVETTNFNPGQALNGFYLPQTAKVTERFTRTAPDRILYQFTVEDPKTYTRPWKAEMPLRATQAKIYEYACHEGNYALPGILAGARTEEKSVQAKPAATAGGR
jgi:hypothetical protein